MPIQVEELEQSTSKEKGEQMEDRDLSQYIKQLIEVKDMELEHEPQNEDNDLMPRAPKVTSQSPPPPVSVLVPSKQGEVVLLGDDLVMDVYNLSFDELKKKIVQVWRKKFLDDHVPRVFMKERMIVSDVRKHPFALTDATLAYARATSSNIKFLLPKNEQMENNL